MSPVYIFPAFLDFSYRKYLIKYIYWSESTDLFQE